MTSVIKIDFITVRIGVADDEREQDWAEWIFEKTDREYKYYPGDEFWETDLSKKMLATGLIIYMGPDSMRLTREGKNVRLLKHYSGKYYLEFDIEYEE